MLAWSGPDAARLFGALPPLGPADLAEAGPHLLVRYGLWAAAPPGWEAAQDSPRYFPGRRLLVPLEAPAFAVGTRPGVPAEYMRLLARPPPGQCRQRAGGPAGGGGGGGAGSVRVAPGGAGGVRAGGAGAVLAGRRAGGGGQGRGG
jgi:hypothetical protein